MVTWSLVSHFSPPLYNTNLNVSELQMILLFWKIDLVLGNTSRGTGWHHNLWVPSPSFWALSILMHILKTRLIYLEYAMCMIIYLTRLGIMLRNFAMFSFSVAKYVDSVLSVLKSENVSRTCNLYGLKYVCVIDVVNKRRWWCILQKLSCYQKYH